jgi:hypothetical protein
VQFLVKTTLPSKKYLQIVALVSSIFTAARKLAKWDDLPAFALWEISLKQASFTQNGLYLEVAELSKYIIVLLTIHTLD